MKNPVMVEHCNFVLPSRVNCEREMKKCVKTPSSAADSLAQVLPHMTFIAVMDNAIPKKDGGLSSPLSSEGLPHEDDCNDALAEILSSALS